MAGGFILVFFRISISWSFDVRRAVLFGIMWGFFSWNNFEFCCKNLKKTEKQLTNSALPPYLLHVVGYAKNSVNFFFGFQQKTGTSSLVLCPHVTIFLGSFFHGRWITSRTCSQRTGRPCAGNRRLPGTTRTTPTLVGGRSSAA